MTKEAGVLCATEYGCNEVHWPVHDDLSDILSGSVKETSPTALAIEDEQRGFVKHGSDELVDRLSVGEGPLSISYSGDLCFAKSKPHLFQEMRYRDRIAPVECISNQIPALV